MPLSEFEKGYLSGLLDGEGSITVFKNREQRGLAKRTRSKLGFTLGINVRIHNTNLELLNHINAIYFGHIYRSNKRKNSVYRWEIADKSKIIELLEQLIPYLIVKKDKAIRAVEFCKSRVNRPSFKSGYTDSEIQIAENWREKRAA